MARVGSPDPRASSEYAPQAAPAVSIIAAEAGSGEVRPGSSRVASPPAANAKPAHWRQLIDSPRNTAPMSIVNCTAANSSSAPVAAPSDRYASENSSA